MSDDVKMLREAADVTEKHLDAAEKVFDDWFSDDDQIDWERFIDKLADPNGYGNAGKFDFDVYDNPAIRKIQRHVRKYRDEA